MARKSRKNSIQEIPAVVSDINVATAVYVRLSVENSGKNDDGDSIEHQKEMCITYIDEHPELQPYIVFEDNGKKGTDFNRPAFDRMMNEIRSGNIKNVIVKDLSRLGRNYIETGNYLEKIFPFLGVRFIAVTDHYDSFQNRATEDTLMIPFKNMINEMYAKDISRKIITSLRTKQQNGTYLQPAVAYGYLKSKTVKFGLEIDEEVADNVRNIFKWAVEGTSMNEISKRLDKMGAVTPAERKIQLGIWKKEKHNVSYWTLQTVSNILKNPIYTGNLVYGRIVRSLCDNIKPHFVPADEWQYIKNHHDAIITKEEFDFVQKAFEQRKQNHKKVLDDSEELRRSFVNLLEGKIYCGKCGRRMNLIKATVHRRRPNYMCSGSAGYRHNKCSVGSIVDRKVYDAVLTRIQLDAYLAIDTEELRKRLTGTAKESKALVNDANIINGLIIQLNTVIQKQEQLYMHWLDGVLDEFEYKHMKRKYDSKRNNLEQSLHEAYLKQNKIRDTLIGGQKWMKMLINSVESKELTQEMVDCFVEEIRIYDNRRIEIVMKYAKDLSEIKVKLQEIEENFA